MRPKSLAWYRLRWPRELDIERLHAMSLLLASSAGAPVVLEAVGRSGSVEHRLGLPASRAGAVVEQVRAALPSLGLVALDPRPAVGVTRALELRLTTPQRSLHVDQAELVSRAVLTALGLTRRDEELVLQWQLLTGLPPARVANVSEHAEPLPASIADVLLGRRGRLDAEAIQALRAKRALPVWRAVGRVAVRATSAARQQMLLRELLAALRLADAPGVRLEFPRFRGQGLIRRLALHVRPGG